MKIWIWIRDMALIGTTMKMQMKLITWIRDVADTKMRAWKKQMASLPRHRQLEAERMQVCDCDVDFVDDDDHDDDGHPSNAQRHLQTKRIFVSQQCWPA